MTEPTTTSATHREQAWQDWIERTPEYTTRRAWEDGYDAALTLAATLAQTLDSVQQELARDRLEAWGRSTGNEAAYYVSIRRRIRQALTHYHKALG